MEIIEKIILSISHYGPVGSQIICPRLHDESCEVLLKNLNVAGVLMDSKLSEKTFKYNIKNFERESTVPIETIIPKYIVQHLQSYLLRDGNGLELMLRDWEEISSRPQKGIIGGTFSGRFGISGKLIINREDPKIEIINNVKKALEETYMKRFNENPLYSRFRAH